MRLEAGIKRTSYKVAPPLTMQPGRKEKENGDAKLISDLIYIPQLPQAGTPI